MSSPQRLLLPLHRRSTAKDTWIVLGIEAQIFGPLQRLVPNPAMLRFCGQLGLHGNVHKLQHLNRSSRDVPSHVTGSHFELLAKQLVGMLVELVSDAVDEHSCLGIRTVIFQSRERPLQDESLVSLQRKLVHESDMASSFSYKGQLLWVPLSIYHNCSVNSCLFSFTRREETDLILLRDPEKSATKLFFCYRYKKLFDVRLGVRISQHASRPF